LIQHAGEDRFLQQLPPPPTSAPLDSERPPATASILSKIKALTVLTKQTAATRDNDIPRGAEQENSF
jgi:hypothetical protein